MKALYHGRFRKQYRRLLPALKEKFKNRRDLFLLNSFVPILRNHPLHHPYEGCWSIDVTGDYRAIYKPITESVVIFIAIGTHSQLYD